MPSQEDDTYFYEHRFHPLLEALAGLDRRYVLRDAKGKRLRAIVQDVPALEAALAVMERLSGELVSA
jgi:transcription-repair coupling factor (superfamily II helicase)